ncbi:MAG: hypothetical protein AAF799_37435 [Myxococcota bacterium]
MATRTNLSIRVVLGLVGVTLVLNGIQWGFLPASNLDANSISVGSALGMNMLKSDIGGPLIATGTFALLAGIRGARWALPVAISAGAYLVVRIVSLAVDGYSTLAAVGVGMEALVLGLAVLLWRGRGGEQ